MMKKYKIAVGGMNHESNTFNPIITGENEFVVLRGKEFESKVGDTYNSAKGLYEKLKSYGYDVIPTVFARAVPNGVVSKDFYLKIKNEMIERIKEIGEIDAISLSLHGSMRVQEIGDAEGDLLKSLKEIFKDVPIFASLDMHATITKDMTENCNGYVGYKTAPHIDTYETGAHAAYLTHCYLESGKNVYMSAYKIPILIAGEKSETSVEPMTSMINLLKKEEENPNILAASYLLGFPWADSKDAGVTALVIADDKNIANQCAKKLAAEFWNRKEDFKFHVETYSNTEAINIAINAKERPLYLSDSGDNPTAGAAGDSVDFINDLLKNDLVKQYNKDILYSGFFDPVSCEKCFEAGENADVDIELGGKFDNISKGTVKLNVKVIKLNECYGTYKSKIALVKYQNIFIVITSKHIGFGDNELLHSIGIDEYKCDIVILKLGYLEDCFKPSSKRAIMAASKGASCEILEDLPFNKVPRPIYPLDKNFNIDIEKALIK